MKRRQNARRLPPTGATPSPYPLTRLPVGAYLLVYFLIYGLSVGLGFIPRQKLIKKLEIPILFAWNYLRKQENKI